MDKLLEDMPAAKRGRPKKVAKGQHVFKPAEQMMRSQIANAGLPVNETALRKACRLLEAARRARPSQQSKTASQSFQVCEDEDGDRILRGPLKLIIYSRRPSHRNTKHIWTSGSNRGRNILYYKIGKPDASHPPNSQLLRCDHELPLPIYKALLSEEEVEEGPVASTNPNS